MKIEWLIFNVIAVGSPGGAERAILGLVLAECVFGQSRSCLCSGGALCGVATPF